MVSGNVIPKSAMYGPRETQDGCDLPICLPSGESESPACMTSCGSVRIATCSATRAVARKVKCDAHYDGYLLPNAFESNFVII